MSKASSADIYMRVCIERMHDCETKKFSYFPAISIKYIKINFEKLKLKNSRCNTSST